MFGGRLPVLAELSGPLADTRPWSLGGADLERLQKLRGRIGSRRTLLVTGSGAAGGVLATGIAAAAAAGGTRTVLVDCGLAAAALAGQLGLEPAPGVHEYLRWEATPRELLQPLALAGPASADAEEPLAFIAAGRTAADPATLLGLQSFRHMSAKLRHAYELVVVSGPPLDGEGGALAATVAESDAVIAAIGPEQRGRSSRRALRHELRRLGAKPLGVVVVG
jgi:Mrp family chromosome partitioning ATPase